MKAEVELMNMTEPYLEILKIYFNSNDSDTINNALYQAYWKLWDLDPAAMKKAADEYHNRL